jgi:cysteine dioxygenase
LFDVPCGAALEAQLSALLSGVAFNPREWRGMGCWDEAHFTRVLLATGPCFNLVLSCWGPGQGSPPHDHAGSRSWVKVLEGSLLETIYDGPAVGASCSCDATAATQESPAGGGSKAARLGVARVGTLGADSVTFLGPRTVHAVANYGAVRAFSLHLYAPPYTRATVFDSGAAVSIPIPSCLHASF